MRLQTLYFLGALGVAAVPLAAGAQTLPANNPWTNSQAALPGNDQPPANAQADLQAVPQCPRVMIGSLPDISAAANGILPSAGRAVTQYTFKGIAEVRGARQRPAPCFGVYARMETWT